MQAHIVCDRALTTRPSADGLHLILLSGGDGRLALNGQSFAIVPPLFACLQDEDRLVLDGLQTWNIQSLHFQPALINSKLTTPVLRQKKNVGATTDQLDADFLVPFIHRTPLLPGLYKIAPSTEAHLSYLFGQLQQHLVSESVFWPCRTRSWLLEILLLVNEIVRRPFPQHPPQKLDDRSGMDSVLDFLLQHYNHPLTLEHIARACGTNRTSLTERFRQATGQTVLQYLEQLRMQAAQALILETKLPVAEIANRVGYENLSHFGRLFKKTTGFSPSRYRNQFL